VIARVRAWQLAAALTLALAPLAFLHPVRISGRSMAPGLESGTVRLALRAWCAGPPAQGQVWLVRAPGGAVVKRLVGLPGDHLELRDGRLWRNGTQILEPYINDPDRESGGPWFDGPGYFLLGDNRGASRDSRAWGPLPPGALLAQVMGW
jgi:signal peptidase I